MNKFTKRNISTLNHTQIAIHIVIRTDRDLDVFQAVVNVTSPVGHVQKQIRNFLADVTESLRFVGMVFGIGARSLAWGVL